MNTLIVVTGPTASGKTDLSVGLAVALGCEIISADSRQIYRGMEIGTAAPTSQQTKMVRHHLISFLEPDEYYSASRYERDVIKLLPELFRQSPYVILTGGSGLYVNAVCEGIDDIPDVDPEIRKRYISRLSEEGIESLRAELRLVDPDHYARVDLKNPRRIMRALEIYATTGRPYSKFLSGNSIKRNFRIIMTGIMPPRDILYERINRRVDYMIEAGLEEEVIRLLPFRHTNALQTVGYRELYSYLDGDITRSAAIDLIRQNTRRYARRQITWWSKRKDIRWFAGTGRDEALDYLNGLEGINIQG